jgi:predicted phage baseplate assembly protein
MPLPDIQLDDRKFEDIFQEARRRIPAYTPEWTDHNESDPGITMLQLFAWLQEMILYRLNQVPQKNYIKFLELVGLPLIAPAPAKAELTFTLAQNAPATLIPPGTQVSLSSGGDGLPVIFETDDNLLAVSLKLVSIQSFDGSLFSSFTDADQTAGQSFAALSAFPEAGTALYLGSTRSSRPDRIASRSMSGLPEWSARSREAGLPRRSRLPRCSRRGSTMPGTRRGGRRSASHPTPPPA